jgi:tetratricopeptide (TPR) repeat protein
VFGGAKPLDGVLSLGPENFVSRVPAYLAVAGCEGAKEGVASSADAFARIYGAPLPPEVDALFAAARGRDCFEELNLDATLIADVADENLFERVLAHGAIDAFCGLFCIGAQSNGDTYHMEIYEWDGPRQVLHFDHKTHTFTGVIADSLDSLVYQAALSRAAKRRQISDEVHALGERKLQGKVAPTIDAKRRDAEFFFSRSRWICALLDGNVDIAEIPSLFMPDFNQIVPADQLEARFEACETIIPTALYSMWRAFFFDESELARYLDIGARHKSRLVRDAATLIEELRDGRNTLGSIKNMRARLASFRALALDPRTSPLDVAWQSLENAAAHRALVARFAAIPALAAQIDRLEELRGLSAADRAAAIETLARDLAPELEAILVGAVIRGDHARPARPPTAPTSAEEVTALVKTKSPKDRLGAALAMTRRALALDPSDDTTKFTHSMLLLEAGMFEDLAQRWPSLSSQNQEALVDKVAPALDDACVKAHAEKAYDVAVRLAQAAQPFAAAYPSLHHSAACAFAAVGDYARAFEQVKLAIEHNAEHVADMEVDSHLGPLLDWPEFKALFRDWHARKEGN